MNWVFENNFQAGFTPFSSLLVFKDFTFCLYGDVLRDRIHNDDLQRNCPGYQRLFSRALRREFSVSAEGRHSFGEIGNRARKVSGVVRK